MMDKDAKRDKPKRKKREPDIEHFEEDKDSIDYAAFRARERSRGFDYKRY